MLENLYIKNVALIKEQSIDLRAGLNIISGESGSGKSMFIDAINFVLGNKTKKDFIRHLEDEATVYATFFIENDEIIELLKSLDIEVLEDNQVQIKRSINIKNKTTIKINGRPVTLSTLKDVSNFLVDIHLQKDNFHILKKSSHIDYLDLVCANELKPFKDDLKNKVLRYRHINSELKDLINQEQEKQRRLDDVNFQLEELNEADLVIGEDVELNEKQKMLANAEKISKNSNEIVKLLYNAQDEMSSYDMITNAIEFLEEIEDVSSEFKQLKETLIDVQINVEEVALSIRDFTEDMGGGKQELDEIEERLALIFKLKKKYGNTIEEILDYKDEIENEAFKLTHSDKIIARLKNDVQILEKECLSICKEMTLIRKKNIKNVCTSIIDTLVDLGMSDVVFDVKISSNNNFTENGIDDVAFYISTNKGQDLKELEKIVSGGEMSRIMIAIKKLISSNYQIETFIFDEIDTGVSGRTAQKVGEKLLDISKDHQIICITHLPQIASLGDNNILIYKETIEDETYTNIKMLDNDGKTDEIARLIGGHSINDDAINYAKEMVKMAKGVS